MHRRILIGEQWKWYFEDLALPFIVAVSVAGIGKFLLPADGTKFETIVGILIISALTFFLTVFSTKVTRNYLIAFRNMAFAFVSKN
jgi:hypothetical protein